MDNVQKTILQIIANFILAAVRTSNLTYCGEMIWNQIRRHLSDGLSRRELEASMVLRDYVQSNLSRVLNLTI
jgi:hypothetical protein